MLFGCYAWMSSSLKRGDSVWNAWMIDYWSTCKDGFYRFHLCCCELGDVSRWTIPLDFHLQILTALVRCSSLSAKGAKENALTETAFCQGRIKTYPRCHLDLRDDRTLSRVPTYPLANDVCLQRRRILCKCTYIWLRPRRSIWQLVSCLILSIAGSL